MPQSAIQPSRLLTRSDVMNRIEVREPYFALRHIQMDPSGQICAEVPVEQSLGLEALPISGAEAGRHLAIIGSVAAAFANSKNEKHYYLAHKARLRRMTTSLSASSASRPLVAVASGELTSKRIAAAHALLSVSGNEPIFSLDVEYHVIAEAVFDKLYKDQRRELRSHQRHDTNEQESAHFIQLRSNPYGSLLPFYDIAFTPEYVSASIREVSSRYCMGHFPFYPALPVAILASGLSNLSGHLLRYRLQEKGPIAYVVTQSDLTADNLAFAGDHVDMTARYIDSDGLNHRFHSQAIANGDRIVGDMILTLTEVDV